MASVQDRVLVYLRGHPEGVDDDDLAEAMGWNHRQQANAYCRRMADAGLVRRTVVDGKIRDFAVDREEAPAAPGVAPVQPLPLGDPSRPWYWEGNVQARVVEYLLRNGYAILSQASTARHERGKDIVARFQDKVLWVTVKGYPRGTPRTRPSTQAGHWFKDAVFDVLAWRGSDPGPSIAVALPDFPRYRRLAARVAWLMPIARFGFLWVNEEGKIEASGDVTL